MKQSTRYFSIGLFVIIGFMLFVLGCILFGGSQLFAKKLYFETYFATSVQGLEVGSPVKFRGVKIGKVEEVGFAGSRYSEREEVDMKQRGIHRALSYIRVSGSIDLKEHPHFSQDRLEAMLKRGLRANLELQGITGSVFINLDFARDRTLADAENTLVVPWKPDDLYIPSVPNTLQSFVSVAENIADKLDKMDLTQAVDSITELVNTTTVALDKADLPKVAETFATLGESLTAQSEKVGELVAAIDSQALGQDLRTMTDNLCQTTAALRESLPQLTASADETLKQTQSTLGDASAFLKTSSETLQGFNQHVDMAAVGAELESTLTTLSRASLALEALINELREKPSRLIFDSPRD